MTSSLLELLVAAKNVTFSHFFDIPENKSVIKYCHDMRMNRGSQFFLKIMLTVNSKRDILSSLYESLSLLTICGFW